MAVKAKAEENQKKIKIKIHKNKYFYNFFSICVKNTFICSV